MYTLRFLQNPVFLNDQKTISKPFYNFFLGRSQAVGKACMYHHSTIIPPSGKLLRIGNLGLADY